MDNVIDLSIQRIKRRGLQNENAARLRCMANHPAGKGKEK